MPVETVHQDNVIQLQFLWNLKTWVLKVNWGSNIERELIYLNLKIALIGLSVYQRRGGKKKRYKDNKMLHWGKKDLILEVERTIYIDLMLYAVKIVAY